MVTTAFVKIWGETVGAVAWYEDRGLAGFEYDPAFVRRGWDLAPLMMPVVRGPAIYTFPELSRREEYELDTFRGLPGLLADVLPDRYGNQLINVWLAQQGRPQNSMNPVEMLCFIGTRGMGALEFEPAHFGDTRRTFAVEVDSLVDVARQMLQKRERFTAGLQADSERAMNRILRIGTSAGGARPKAVIAFNEKTGEVRSGQTRAPSGFEHWLIKLDGVSDVQLGESLGYGRVEYAYYRMALDCGIEMMPSRLLEENGRAHFMTKRFDRDGQEGKHHIQTWCAMRHFDYNDVRSFSYEQLFQTMRELKLPYPAAEQMFRRMVFNVLARNCDDHTKNVSFRLKKGGEWELAPAYDLCYAYRPDSQWVSRHALSINGKRDRITREDLIGVAGAMSIRKASGIIAQIESVVSGWDRYAKKAGVSNTLREKISENRIRLE